MSDHAAVIACIAARSARKPAEKIFPVHTCTALAFNKRPQGLIDASDWKSTSLPFRLEHFEELLKISGK